MNSSAMRKEQTRDGEEMRDKAIWLPLLETIALRCRTGNPRDAQPPALLHMSLSFTCSSMTFFDLYSSTNYSHTFFNYPKTAKTIKAFSKKFKFKSVRVIRLRVALNVIKYNTDSDHTRLTLTAIRAHYNYNPNNKTSHIHRSFKCSNKIYKKKNKWEIARRIF